MTRTRTRWLISAVTLLAALLTAATVHAEEAFYRVPFDELEVTEGEIPDTLAWPGWQVGSIAPVLHYAVIDGEGEAYLKDIERQNRWAWQRDDNTDTRELLVRTPEPREVTGTIYLAAGDETHDGLLDPGHRIRFRIPADRADAEARQAYYETMQAHYGQLLEADVAGAAWFRHRLRVAARMLDEGGDNQAVNELQTNATWFSNDNDLWSMFTGGRAVSENLQLNRLMPDAQGDADRMVSLDGIDGITIEEYEFNVPPEARIDTDPLADVVPFDQYVVFFQTFNDLVAVSDLIEQNGTAVLRLAEPRSIDMQLASRYRDQLALPLSELARRFGPQIIQSVAMTGSDPYLPTGSDLAVLFQSDQAEALQSILRGRQQGAAAQLADAESFDGEYKGVTFQAVRTPDRRLCSYLATLDDAVVVANSRYQLERIIDTQQGGVEALGAREEYRFFRQRYDRGDADESALVIMPDAAIRKWCGPRWRIGASRRLRAAAVLGELQSRHADELVRGDVEPHAIDSPFDIPGGVGDLQLASGGVRSGKYNTLNFITPIAEMELDQVTQVEARRYRQWRDQYQNAWGNMYDPIALRLSITEDAITTDLSVMPLITSSDYRQPMQLFTGLMQDADLRAEDGDPHADTLLHAVISINKDSQAFMQAENYAAMGAGNLGAHPLSWMGNSIAFYIDDTPFWDELAKFGNDDEAKEDFVEDNIDRLPFAVQFEVTDGPKMRAFITAMRRTAQRESDSAFAFETREYKDEGYVRITPTEQIIQQEPSAEGIAVYYAPTDTALIISVSEDLIKRAIDRQVARRAAVANGQQPGDGADDADHLARPPRPWIGKHIGMQASEEARKLAEEYLDPELQQTMHRASWSNIAILNEWKRLYPDRDPVNVHQRIYGQTLIDPNGGQYEWLAKFNSMGSTNYGLPMQPQRGPGLPAALRAFRFGNFGLTFEQDGLRAKVELLRTEQGAQE